MYPYENPYDHSRLLDVYTWSDHPEVNIFVDSIYDAYFLGGNERIRKKHLKVVLLDLYVAWKEDPELYIAFHRDVNFYKARSRYNALHISKLTIKVIDRLVEAEFIFFLVGFHDERKGGISRVSRIWPTDKLISFAKQSLASLMFRFTWVKSVLSSGTLILQPARNLTKNMMTLGKHVECGPSSKNIIPSCLRPTSIFRASRPTSLILEII